MRWYRHPLATLGLCWLLVSGLFIFAMCSLPGPRPTTLTEAPTPTRVPMIVQPTVFVFTTPVPSPTAVPREALPASTSTRVPPTPTPTVEPPTATPTINSTPPVQRG